MRRSIRNPFGVAVFLAAVFAPLMFSSFAAAEDVPPKDPNAGKPVADQLLLEHLFGRVREDADGAKPSRPEQASEFWIGISGNPVDEALRSHLVLAADQGILVSEVAVGSPAEKAGLKLNDILLSIGDKPLKEIAELIAIIDQSKEARLTIGLIRGGKPIIMHVTPERRPANQTGETCPSISKVPDDVFLRRVYLDLAGMPPDDETTTQFVKDKSSDKRTMVVNRLLRQSRAADKSCVSCHAPESGSKHYSGVRHLLSDPHGGGTWKSEFVPVDDSLIIMDLGVLLNARAADELRKSQALPEDVTIAVTRKGQEPAKISVRKGDRVQEATEEDYREKIAEELRGYVAAALQGGLAKEAARGPTITRHGADFRVNFNGAGASPQATTAEKPTVYPVDKPPAHADERKPAATPGGADDALERLAKQLDAMQSRFEELQKAMQDLQKARRAAPPRSSDGASK